MKKYSLIYTLSIILMIGFLATTLISYFVSKTSIRSSVINYELPLITSDIYSEIQKELVEPVLVADMMAKDRFLRDWVTHGERDESRMLAYLHDVQANHQHSKVSYFVSEYSHKYYYSDGKTRIIKKSEPGDAWYFRFRDGKQDYVLNIDADVPTPDVFVLYVDHKVVDDAGKFLGVAGNGMALDDLKNIIKNYQAYYQRTIYFVDSKGQIRLSDGDAKPIGKDIQAFTGDKVFKAIFAQQGNSASPLKAHHEYVYQGNTYLLNAKYVPELKWFLMVEKNEAQSAELLENKKILYINLGVCALVTAIALLLTQASIKRYQTQIERLATTDSLTGLSNRRAFDVMIRGFLNDSQRHNQPVSAILFDLDNFKNVNDTYGHEAGDLVLREVACELTAHIRQADLFCRWGGEEFLVLLKNCKNDEARHVAETLRATIKHLTVHYQNHQLNITGSFGVVTLRAGEKTEQLILRADENLYAAKHAGKNRVVASE